LFRVTHPFHPLYGREFSLVAHHRSWDEDRVFYRDEDGRLSSFPARWTSVVAPDPVVVFSEGRSAFRLQDLVELVQLVQQISGKGGGL